MESKKFSEVKLAITPSFVLEIIKNGYDYCGSTDKEVFKKQYIGECGDDAYRQLVIGHMLTDGWLIKVKKGRDKPIEYIECGADGLDNIVRWAIDLPKETAERIARKTEQEKQEQAELVCKDCERGIIELEANDIEMAWSGDYYNCKDCLNLKIGG